MPHLSMRLRMYVGVLFLAACALLLWRPSFPYWIRPEYYEQLKISEFASDVERIMRGRQDIADRSILVVGDSMVALWPWDADVISIPAGYPLRLRDTMEEQLSTQHYDMVIVWVGTAMIAHQRAWHPFDPEQFLADLDAIVQTALRFTDRPVVITPMEIPGVQYFGITDRLLQDTDHEVFDSRGIRAAGGSSMYLRDNFHLSPTGFAELGREMAKHGIEVELQPTVATASVQASAPAGVPHSEPLSTSQ